MQMAGVLPLHLKTNVWVNKHQSCLKSLASNITEISVSFAVYKGPIVFVSFVVEASTSQKLPE